MCIKARIRRACFKCKSSIKTSHRYIRLTLSRSEEWFASLRQHDQEYNPVRDVEPESPSMDTGAKENSGTGASLSPASSISIDPPQDVKAPVEDNSPAAQAPLETPPPVP